MADLEAQARIVLTGAQDALRTVEGVKRRTDDAGKRQRENAKSQERAAKDSQRAQERAAQSAQRAVERQQKAQERAAQSQKRLEQAATEANKREHEKRTKEAERAAQARVRAEEKAAKEIARVQQAETERWRRMSAESARQRMAEEERSSRSRARNREGVLRRAGGALAGLAVGAGAGAMMAANTARDVAGVQSVQERIKRGGDFRERLIITSAQAGVSNDKRQEIQGQIQSAATRSGKDPLEILGALELAQKSFNGFETFAGMIEELAITAKASGSDVQDLTGALGYVQKAFGLTQEESKQALDLMVAAAAKGSIELSDFARDFAPVAGIFAMSTQQKGIAGVRSFLGTSQGVGTGGFGSAESATRVERLVAEMNDSKTRAKLKAAGVKLPKSGEAINMGDFLEQIATNKNLQTSEQRQRIFTEVRASQGLDTLLAARQHVQSGAKDAIDFNTIAGVGANEGKNLTRNTMAQLESAGVLDLQREATKAQNDVITNLQKYNDQILAVVRVSGELERSLGSLSLWAPSIASTGLGGLLGGLLPGLFGGGAGAGAAGAGATAAGGTLAGSVATAGAGALAGAVGIGGIVGGATGYAIDKGTEWATGKSISDRGADWLFKLFEGGSADEVRANQSSRTNGGRQPDGLSDDPRSLSISSKLDQQTAESQKQTRLLEEIARKAQGGPMSVNPDPRRPR